MMGGLCGGLRRVVLLGAGLVLLLTQGGAAPEVPRPRFHYSPAANWMSDPDGLIFYEGEYHLFYQYNPRGNKWGHMSWGHAISPDLVHWHELPVAIPESDVAIFSGSVVIDQTNSSGLGRNGQPPLVAIFTGSRPADRHEAEYLAYSLDKGRTWTRDGTAPVLDTSSTQRDPKVFWHAASGRWVMVLARADAGGVAIYTSTDLHHWSHASDFANPMAVADTWECPDLFEMPVEGEAGQTRWVMIASVNAGTPADGGNIRYLVGTFDGTRFVADPASKAIPAWMNYGADFYAAASWNGIPAADGRRVLIAWASNFFYGSQMPATPARGVMSVPRVLVLVPTEHGYRLSQSPVQALNSLRTIHQSRKDMALSSSPAALPVAGAAVDLEVTAEVGSASQIVFTIADSEGGRTLFGIDVARKTLFVDRTRSGPAIGEHFLARHDAPIAIDNGQVRFRVLFDQSIIELFGDDGTKTITDRIFPANGALSWSVETGGGAASLKRLDTWDMTGSLDRITN